MAPGEAGHPHEELEQGERGGIENEESCDPKSARAPERLGPGQPGEQAAPAERPAQEKRHTLALEARPGKHSRGGGQEQERGYARPRMGEGDKERARGRLHPEAVGQREPEDEGGGPLQTRLARAAGKKGEPGTKTGAREHEPAPGEKLAQPGDRERERECPQEAGEVALGAKD